MLERQIEGRLADWCPWRKWRAERAAAVFKSDASLEWFIRRHRAEVVASGTFIPRPGRAGGLVDPIPFEQLVLDILRREAA